MMRYRGWTDERRDNLGELDPALRDRLFALDEPVARSDWAAVVRRSHAVRLSSRRTLVLAALAAVVASLSAAGAIVGFGALSESGTAHASSPVRLALRMGDGRGLVFYSRASQERFVDGNDDRVRGVASLQSEGSAPAISTAVARTLTVTGPFRVDRAALRVTDSLDGAVEGPLPGDRALFAFNLYTTVGLDRRAGSAVFTCRFSFDHNAQCDAAFDLSDGSQLMAVGVLNAGSTNVTLVVTSGQGARRGVVQGTRVHRT